MPKEGTAQEETSEQLAFPMAVKRNGTNNHNPTLPPNAIELKPKLVPHKKAESDFEALSLRNAAKRNVGTFFTNLYVGLFPESGYELAVRRRMKLSNGDWREINPDIFQRTLLGDKFIEVKGALAKESRARCFVRQAENYFYLNLKEIMNREKRPVVRYAFFRYGGWKDTFNLHSQTEVEAMKTLAGSKKDALITATNQALLLFMLSRIDSRPHESMDDANYFVVNGSAITLLHDPKSKDLGYFLDTYEEQLRHDLEWKQKRGRIMEETAERKIRDFKSVKRFARQGFMHLDDLTVERFQSDKHGSLVYGDVTLPVFPVTVYSIKNYPQWLNDFRKYHERILGRANLRDLFAEDQRYRARRPKKDGPF